MLVCNVSLRPPRASIPADLAEVAAALDDTGAGNVVFATLVDDPASVSDIVDAYSGEIMIEAASANTVVDASIPATYAAAINETAAAVDTTDATAGVATATWDPATVSSVTLSGGNLVATNTGTTSGDQGAKVASAGGKNSGKYYYETTFTDMSHGGGNRSIGVGTTASTYTSMGSSGDTGVAYFVGGSVYANGSYTGINLAGWSTGQTYRVAVDLDNRKIWFSLAPTGLWNNSGTDNPVTNAGGLTIPAGTMVPFCTFGGSAGASGNVYTANFGASAFSGTVPSGFTSGWPV